MMPAAQRQPVLIGEGREIVRMRAFHDEADQRAASLVRPEHAHPGQFGEPLCGVAGQFRIVLENRRASDALEIIDRRRQPDRAGDVRRARLETGAALF